MRRARIWRWLVAAFLCAGLIGISIRFVDRPVARLAARFHLFNGVLSSGLVQSPILVGLAALAVFIAGLLLALDLQLPPWLRSLLRAALLSGLAMSWGLCVTEFLLKPLFGRTLPGEYLLNGSYAFHWFEHGDQFGSFPSGHTVQIASIAMVVWTLYPRWRWACVFAVGLVAVALILAERHFVSDIIAGGLLGAVSGRLMTRTWQTAENARSAV